MYEENILISVIMSVYNGEKYLRDAIESILCQTYKKFEFIVINDGSTDKTLEILEFYSRKDNRIKIINNKINKGLIYSLNKGISLAKGKYIARMDADDISEKNRLEEQLKYLEKNKSVAMCSTYIKIFKNSLKQITKVFKTDTEYERIKVKLLFRNYIAHPTIMIRKDIVEKYKLKYESEDKGMEDYGLWLKLIKKEEIVTIPQPLLKYRFLSNSISSKVLKNPREYKVILKKIYRRELSDIFSKLSETEIDIHIEIVLINNIENYEYSLEEKINYLKKLKKLLEQERKYKEKIVEKEISDRITECYINHCNIFEILKLKKKSIGFKQIFYIKLRKILKKLIRN